MLKSRAWASSWEEGRERGSWRNSSFPLERLGEGDLISECPEPLAMCLDQVFSRNSPEVTGDTTSNLPSNREPPSDPRPRAGEEPFSSFLRPKTLDRNEGIAWCDYWEGEMKSNHVSKDVSCQIITLWHSPVTRIVRVKIAGRWQPKWLVDGVGCGEEAATRVCCTPPATCACEHICY